MEKIATALANAGNQLDTANAAAWELCEPTPTVLVRTTDLVDTTAARTAWNAWHSCISLDDPTELRDALRTRHRSLVEALDALRTSAQEQATTMDHVWRPLAAVLLEWHRAAAEVQADTQLLVDITAAENWIKQAAAQLRVERMAPFAEQSQEIWRKLRQQSNVDLGAISLEGTANTNKRVELNVSVDGVENAALAVMSQGELHALGLALFLPRATVDESPFRFLVIDDPVQAMDPAKVDGLAQVLADAALTRQVVVFTHDERLAEAVRRLRLPATVWEVCRRERSVVEVRKSDSPVSRYLADARALLNTDDLPGELRSELVISFCRNAVEAASHTKVRELRLGRGVPHTEVEQALDVAHTTHQKVTLAVFDDPARSGDLLQRLRSALGPWAPTALQNCKQGAHVGYTGDLAGLVDDTRRLADWLQR
jgi:ABC-type lipoprotein export system ATPase subunit